MIYVTGDTHGDIRRLNSESFPEQKEMTKDDYVIILGDFGLVWEQEESKEEKHWLDWLERKPFTTLFVDGNHENFARLNVYLEEEWHGGTVHRIRPSVIHLMRGYVYDIDGAKCFSFGGAPSHDINGLATKEELEENYAAGILDRSDPSFEEKVKWIRYYQKQGQQIYARILNESWWREELATEAEIQRGRENLEKVKNKVDFVFSHEGPASAVALGWMGRFKPNRQSQYLEEIRRNLDYRAWLFGHYHENRRIGEKEICLYEQITRIW